jgi:hypothetical protein
MMGVKSEQDVHKAFRWVADRLKPGKAQEIVEIGKRSLWTP